MLNFESEGFLEVEASALGKLSRSLASVTLRDRAENSFELYAVLCELAGTSPPRCLVAFHARDLKRSVVFSIDNSEQPAWSYGERLLTEMGFLLDGVKLNLSPAMLEVVLRDVPGLASPEVAARQRAERAASLAEFQRLIDEDPDSPAGKKAALKLGSEKRLEERAAALRNFLEEFFVEEQQAEESNRLEQQVEALNQQLKAAEKRADEERQLRELSEGITAAAEKRIQELEEILVDVETRSADEHKQKRQLISLQEQLKQHEEALAAIKIELTEEQGRQQELVEATQVSQQEIKSLEASLKKAEAAQEKAAGQLEKASTQNDQAIEEKKAALATVKELESRIRTLEKERKESDKQLNRLSQAEQTSDQLQAQADAAESALQEARDLNAELQERLAAAEEEVRESGRRLEQAEAAVADQPDDEGVDQELQALLVQANAERDELREELAREGSIRKRLEKGAAEDDKRIRELEEALAAAGSATASASDASAQSVVELDALRSEVHELKRALRKEQTEREELEGALDQAHRMIDSLEQMVKETEKSPSQAASRSEDKEKTLKLEAKIELLTEQLDQERSRQQELAEALAAAEKSQARAAEALEKKPLNKNIATSAAAPAAAAQDDARAAKPSKPLPHEVRPAPTKGAFFHPDWDLEGLPCQTAEQVFSAWETVYNVQISLEGYPSQYCMAYLVVLNIDKVKKLYMLFRLKQSKHTLVCVPAKTPKNESDLKAAIDEGLKFLKTSGFDMEKMPGEYIESTLSSFFVGA